MLNEMTADTKNELEVKVPDNVSCGLCGEEADPVYSAELFTTLRKDIMLITKYKFPRDEVKAYLFLTKYRNSPLEYEVRALPAAEQRLDMLINECYDTAGLP